MVDILNVWGIKAATSLNIEVNTAVHYVRRKQTDDFYLRTEEFFQLFQFDAYPMKQTYNMDGDLTIFEVSIF